MVRTVDFSRTSTLTHSKRREQHRLRQKRHLADNGEQQTTSDGTKKNLLIGAAEKLALDLLQFLSPWLLKLLIKYTEDRSQHLWTGLSLCTGMFVLSILQSLILQQYFLTMERVAMKISSVLMDSVYRKIFTLSAEPRRKHDVGKIIDLMNSDIQRIQDTLKSVNLFWSSPLQILLGTYFLYQLFGLVAFLGIFVLVAFILVNSKLAALTRLYQKKQMEEKDARLKLLSEMLDGIKVVKLYAWERAFSQKITSLRKKELCELKKIVWLSLGGALPWTLAPFLVAVITFTVYTLVDPKNNVLTPEITFVGLSLFQILRFPLADFPIIFSQASHCAVSYSRLKSFLAVEERPVCSDNLLSKHITGKSSTDHVMKIRNGAFSWTPNGEKCVLHDVNFCLPAGSLVAVIGGVGSGKSSFISAIFGDLYQREGEMKRDWRFTNSLAYVPQQACIQCTTLRENILFGADFNEALYAEVLNACALTEDIDTLTDGDQTQISENGDNLSGGQKQRVCIARAAYSQRDVYVFDDPFSALDSNIRKWVFERVIDGNDALLRNKTRLLIVNSLDSLPRCDIIYVLTTDGQMKGPYEERDFMMTTMAFPMIDDENADDESAYLAQASSAKMTTHDTDKYDSTNSIVAVKPKTLQSGSSNKKSSIKQCQNEPVITGNIKFSIYRKYIGTIGYGMFLTCLALKMMSSGFGIASKFWLANWTDHAKQIQSNESLKELSNSTAMHLHLSIYAILGILEAVTANLTIVLISMTLIEAARRFHDLMLDNVLHSTMLFFHSRPLGSIVNRFSKDVEVVDISIPHFFSLFFHAVFAVLEIFVLITLSMPLFLLAALPLFSLYLYLLYYYLGTSRQLRRLESASRSSIIAHIKESVHGVQTIQAYACAERFISRMQTLIDKHMTNHFCSVIAQRWLVLRIHLISSLIVFSASFSAIWLREREMLTAGLVGLALSYVLNITGTLSWAVQMAANLDANIISVERIMEYIETPEEEKEPSEETRPDSGFSNDWPQKGEIQFKEFSVRYQPGLERALDTLDVTFGPGQRIGIVGRTGAGKSSLALGLFRLVEPDSGNVLIDGVDITRLSLFDLRSRLTIIPQDPVLFAGTVRFNLDPFEREPEDRLWKALDRAHLKDFVSRCGGLSYLISAGGENISEGQRQLFCLARALLRRSRVLVLDEATASVDSHTDTLIQKSIETWFPDSTILNVFHRLETVLNYDRVLVLDQGQMREFGTPKELKADPHSEFGRMVASGANYD